MCACRQNQLTVGQTKTRLNCQFIMPRHGVGEAVAGAVSEAFARWLHRRHIPSNCRRQGHIVSPCDTLIVMTVARQQSATAIETHHHWGNYSK